MFIFEYASDIVISCLILSNIILLLQVYHYKKHSERCTKLVELGSDLKTKLEEIRLILENTDNKEVKNLINTILNTTTTILTLLSKNTDDGGGRL